MGNGAIRFLGGVNEQVVSALTFVDMKIKEMDNPELRYLDDYLATCNNSWKFIIGQPLDPNSELMRSGTDLFLDVFHYHLVATCMNDKIAKLLNRGSELRGCSIVFVMLRYILLLRKKPLKQVQRRLRAIGREHSRINITEEDMFEFCEVLLLAIKERLDKKKTNLIIHAWMVVFKFVVHEMTTQKYLFQRSRSNDSGGQNSEGGAAGGPNRYSSTQMESMIDSQQSPMVMGSGRGHTVHISARSDSGHEGGGVGAGGGLPLLDMNFLTTLDRSGGSGGASRHSFEASLYLQQQCRQGVDGNGSSTTPVFVSSGRSPKIRPGQFSSQSQAQVSQQSQVDGISYRPDPDGDEMLDLVEIPDDEAEQ